MQFKSQEHNPYSFDVKTDEQDFLLSQDVSAYKDYAAESRYKDSLVASNRKYRSFALIPDIVAIDILAKYHIDIHGKEFSQDQSQMTRLKKIIMTDYPQLLTSNVKSV